jgi:hypothetical protein
MTAVRLGDADSDEDALDLIRPQRHVEPGARGGQRLRRGIELESRDALDLIEAHVAQ